MHVQTKGCRSLWALHTIHTSAVPSRAVEVLSASIGSLPALQMQSCTLRLPPLANSTKPTLDGMQRHILTEDYVRVTKRSFWACALSVKGSDSPSISLVAGTTGSSRLSCTRWARMFQSWPEETVPTAAKLKGGSGFLTSSVCTTACNSKLQKLENCRQ